MSSKERLTYRSVMRGYVEQVRAVSNLGDSMFRLAKECLNVSEFLNNCKLEEDWVCSPEAGQSRMSTIPVYWGQAKSNIKRGMEQGLIPSDYPSLSKFRKAKAAINKEKGTVRTTNSRRVHEPQAHVKMAATTEPREERDTGPSDLAEIAELIAPLNRLSRARAIKELTEVATKHRGYHDGNKEEGERRMARPVYSLGSNGRVVASL